MKAPNHWLFVKKFHWSAVVPLTKGKWCGKRFHVRTSSCSSMMTSSNGNIFRVTGHLCGEFTGPGEFPTQRPVTRSFDVFFDLRLNKRLSKQPWACDLRRYRGHYDVSVMKGKWCGKRFHVLTSSCSSLEIYWGGLLWRKTTAVCYLLSHGQTFQLFMLVMNNGLVKIQVTCMNNLAFKTAFLGFIYF